MILQEIKCDMPKWLKTNTFFLTYMGSQAYGVANENSDFDVYGWAIPPKDWIFPPNYIEGFDDRQDKFEQWVQPHLKYQEKDYDFQIYNIVKYFRLCIDGNPNMVDSLFTPLNCIIHNTTVGQMVRENRHIFLSKALYPKFKGYLYSQSHKIVSRNPTPDSKRSNLIEKFGWDVKYGYNAVRIAYEIEQILREENLVLDEPGRREHLKAIRRGELTAEEVVEWVKKKEPELDTLCANSKLRDKKNIGAAKALLVNCLESHYGSIADVIKLSDAELKLSKIHKILSED